MNPGDSDLFDWFIYVLVISAVSAGLYTPFFFLDLNFSEESQSDRVYAVTLISTGMITFAISSYLVSKYKKFGRILDRPILGLPVVVFIGSLLASTSAVLIAIIPIAFWAQTILLIPISIFGLGAFIYISQKK